MTSAAAPWWRQPSLYRYLVVGATVTALDYVLLIVLHGWWQWNVTVAAVTSYLCAFGVNFLLSRRWTFAATAGSSGGQMVRFTILVVANTVLTGLGMAVLTVLGVPYLLAKTGLVMVIVVINYVIMRRWVFRTGEESGHE